MRCSRLSAESIRKQRVALDAIAKRSAKIEAPLNKAGQGKIKRRTSHHDIATHTKHIDRPNFHTHTHTPRIRSSRPRQSLLSPSPSSVKGGRWLRLRQQDQRDRRVFAGGRSKGVAAQQLADDVAPTRSSLRPSSSKSL